jgi:hypothetical protein
MSCTCNGNGRECFHWLNKWWLDSATMEEELMMTHLGHHPSTFLKGLRRIAHKMACITDPSQILIMKYISLILTVILRE